VISHPDQATFQYGKVYRFFFPQKEIAVAPRCPNSIVRILHAPSDRKVKGTNYVLEAVEILRSKGVVFEFSLVENISNEIVIKLLENTDIVIDQPGTSAARFAIEACSASCCVIGGNRSDYMRCYDSPLIQFEPDAKHLASSLLKLINDREYLAAKMQESFLYFKKNYSYDAYRTQFDELRSSSSKSFYPLPVQRELILKGAETLFERIVVYLFYRPKKNPPDAP
jgi:hypothetical protein